MKLKFEIKGLNEVLKLLDGADRKVKTATQAAIYAQGIALDQLANRQGLVPVDTGQLKGSHYLTVPSKTDSLPSSEFGYGAPYAQKVHDRGTGKYKGSYGSRRNGQPQWLKKALYQFRISYYRRLMASIRLYIANGTKINDLLGIIPSTPSMGNVSRSVRARGYNAAQIKKMKSVKIKFVGHGKDKRKKQATKENRKRAAMLRREAKKQKGLKNG